MTTKNGITEYMNWDAKELLEKREQKVNIFGDVISLKCYEEGYYSWISATSNKKYMIELVFTRLSYQMEKIGYRLASIDHKNGKIIIRFHFK